MLTHVVLFFLVDGVEPDDPRVRRACEVEAGLVAAAVEMGATWTFGAGASVRPAAARYVAIGRFASVEELGRFLAHPAHLRAVHAWEGLADAVVGDLHAP